MSNDVFRDRLKLRIDPLLLPHPVAPASDRPARGGLAPDVDRRRGRRAPSARLLELHQGRAVGGELARRADPQRVADPPPPVRAAARAVDAVELQ